MERLKTFYDQHGSTLTTRFGNPDSEHVREETGDEVTLMKERDGQVTGFEKLQFSIPAGERLAVDIEAVG